MKAGGTDVGVRPAGGLAHCRADGTVSLIREPIGDVLRRWAQRQPGAQAIVWETEAGLARMTYAELLAEAERIARVLLDRAAPGDRIGLWSRNALEAFLLEHACALSGTIFTPFNPAWTDHETRQAVELVSPVLTFVGLDSRGRSLAERAAGVFAPGSTTDLFSLRSLRPLQSKALPAVRQSDPFLIQFTSGTTGRAKGALLSHRAALNTGWVRPAGDGAGPDDVWLNAVPIHHVGGSCAVALGALSVGGSFVMLEKHDPAQVARLAEPVRATRMGGVPTMFLDLLNADAFPKGRVPLRVVTLGGASVPAALVRRVAQEWGASVANGYGQSECGVITGTTRADGVEVVATTVGRPRPDAEVKIADLASGATLECGVVGEICVKSGTMMDGYFAMPEATASVIDADGFLHTGDVGSMDEQGYVKVVGRAREVIIRGGENIYPVEVEETLAQHPAVAMCAVVGLDDERWGQIVAAAVQLKAGRSADAAELEAFVGERLAHFKIPRQWRIVQAMPMTASGKVRKIELPPLFA